MSFLSVIGKNVAKVLEWLGSSKGQATIAAGEAVIESVYPPATAALALANNWLTEIIKDEALAAGAGSQSGTGALKAAAVLAAVTPQAIAFAEQNKLAVPTAEKIQQANTALVAFLNAFGETPKAVSTPIV